MKYYIIEELNMNVFMNEIMVFLDENKGWELWGSPFVNRDERYCQAVIKRLT